MDCMWLIDHLGTELFTSCFIFCCLKSISYSLHPKFMFLNVCFRLLWWMSLPSVKIQFWLGLTSVEREALILALCILWSSSTVKNLVSPPALALVEYALLNRFVYSQSVTGHSCCMLTLLALISAQPAGKSSEAGSHKCIPTFLLLCHM
jgi:hypothetical protein